MIQSVIQRIKPNQSGWQAALILLSLCFPLGLAFLPSENSSLRVAFRSLGFLVPGLLAGSVYFKATRTTDKLSRIFISLVGVSIVFRIIEDLFLTVFLTQPMPPIAQASFAWIDLAGWVALAIAIIGLMLSQQKIAIKLKFLLDLFITVGAFLVLWYVIFLNPVTSNTNPDLAIPTDQIWYSIEDVLLVVLSAYVFFFTDQKAHRTFLGLMVLASITFYITDTTIRLDGIGENQILFALSAVTQWLSFALLWYSSRYALRLETEIQEQSSTQQLIAGWAIRERIQETLPIALPLVMVIELLIFWQQNLPIEQTVLVGSAVIWLLLVARLGVAAGEFEMQQYALLFLNSAEAAFLSGPNWKFIQVNPAMVRLCGFSTRESMINQDIRMVLPNFDDFIKSNKLEPSETILLNSAGQRIPVELSHQVILLGFFKRKYHTGVIHDLTAQKNQQEMLQQAYNRVQAMQTELRQLNDDLEQRVVEKTASLETTYRQLEEQHTRLQSLDQMKSDFVSLVSHELRAPLTNISGGIELLLSGKKQISESIRTSLLLVQNEIKRLTRFVETILDLSVLDAGKLPIYPEKILAGAFLKLVRAHYQSIPGANRVIWPPTTDNLSLLVDVQALQSVFIHVLDNALKYAPQGSIQITTSQSGKSIMFTISDAGPGIPEDLRDQIFEKFFRSETADARLIYGHGLGLYMARKLLEEMDGTITVSESPSGGAAFTIQLPEGEQAR